MFFVPIGKTRWPPWPLIGWDIFDFSYKTAERNSTKLDRKQDLNVLYQVCVFRADRKNKMAALASDWLGHFRLLLWNRWTEFNETWQGARSQRLLPSLCFSGRWVNKNFCPGWSFKKLAHCTQVHDMWPFGPLVFFNTAHVCNISQYLNEILQYMAIWFSLGIPTPTCTINHFWGLKQYTLRQSLTKVAVLPVIRSGFYEDRQKFTLCQSECLTQFSSNTK